MCNFIRLAYLITLLFLTSVSGNPGLIFSAFAGIFINNILPSPVPVTDDADADVNLAFGIVEPLSPLIDGGRTNIYN